MARHMPREGSRQCPRRGDDREVPPVQPSSRTHTDQLTHQQCEIETARVGRQPLQNVRPRGVHVAHAARLVKMCEGPLDAFAAEP
jgi:hypothetical protein